MATHKLKRRREASARVTSSPGLNGAWETCAPRVNAIKTTPAGPSVDEVRATAARATPPPPPRDAVPSS